MVSTKDIRVANLIYLFLNPSEQFTRRLLPDLREWERNPPEGAPPLLVFSPATAEANREMGLSALILIDPRFSVASACGATGYPSAIYVEANGARLASDVAAGAPAIMALLKG